MAGRAASLDDKKCGAKLRELRTAAGLTQGQLAEKIGITYQQLHKYECGHNRITIGTVVNIARVLKVNPKMFFDVQTDDSLAPIGNRIKLEMMKLMEDMDAPQRQALVNLARVMRREATE